MTYDYGDIGELRIRLEVIRGRAAGAPPAVCTAGRRAAPPEDCGGVCAYDDLMDHRSVGLGARPDTLDMNEVNEALLASGRRALAIKGAPPLIAAMLRRSTGTADRDLLADMVVGADLGSPTPISIDDATVGVGRYACLLDRVGDAGITLTAAGYLPPVQVSAAMTELGMDQERIGRGNREDPTLPGLHQSESARRLGLPRKHRGRPRLTAAARQARQDPVALSSHIAGRLPEGGADSIEHQAGALYLLGIAAGHDTSTVSFRAVVADSLTAHGWHVDGGPVPADSVRRVSWDTVKVLNTLDAFSPARRSHREGPPTDARRATAGAALQHGATRKNRRGPGSVVVPRTSIRPRPRRLRTAARAVESPGNASARGTPTRGTPGQEPTLPSRLTRETLWS